jgi:DNA-binding transcriptional MerR regulator/effector-binding domain-containing protein
MATTLTIGEFSRMTYLSVKALRHYHDLGVLAPAGIDPRSGYRCYAADQVTAGQVIRRLRDLGMPLDSVRAVLQAPDLAARNREIAAHLERMERQLEQTQAAVSGLRALLGGTAPQPKVEFRFIPAVAALSITQLVSAAGAAAWGTDAFGEILEAVRANGLAAAGPVGALFPGEFFELERSEITAFVPVQQSVSGGRVAAGGSPGTRLAGSGLTGLGRAGTAPAGTTLAGLGPASRVRLTEITGTEAAVAMHDGPPGDADRTYGALGTVVAERAIGVDGPMREYYPDGYDAQAPHRVEICWPVFRTGHS